MRLLFASLRAFACLLIPAGAITVDTNLAKPRDLPTGTYQVNSYLNDLNRMTSAVGLQFFKGQETSDWNRLMAAATGAVLSVVVVFFFTQKLFIQGITLTGLKG